MAAGTSATASSGAASGRPTGIDVVVDGCADITPIELQRLLAVELAGRPAERRDDGALGERVAVACPTVHATETADIAVSRDASGAIATRHIDLSDVPALHRPRIVAIAIVELMAETIEASAALSIPASSAAKSPEAVASPASTGGPPGAGDSLVEHAGSTGPRRWRFSVGAVTFRSMGLDAFLWGASGNARFDLSNHFAGEMDLVSAGNSIALSLGSADVVLVTAGASAVARIDMGRLEWNGGVGLRGGIARFAGRPASNPSPSIASVDAGTFVEPWGGPLVMSRVAAHPSPQLSFLLGVEGGYSLTSVVGKVDGVTEIALRRLWFGLSLGLGWSP